MASASEMSGVQARIAALPAGEATTVLKSLADMLQRMEGNFVAHVGDNAGQFDNVTQRMAAFDGMCAC